MKAQYIQDSYHVNLPCAQVSHCGITAILRTEDVTDCINVTASGFLDSASSLSNITAAPTGYAASRHVSLLAICCFQKSWDSV